MTDPVIESLTAAQRDTLASYLVDIDYIVYEEDSEDVTFTLEYRLGDAGAWSTCTPQSSDRKHDSIASAVAIADASPGTSRRFVWMAFFDLGDGVFDNVYIRLVAEDSAAESSEEIFGPLVVDAQEPDTEDEKYQSRLTRRRQANLAPDDFLGNGLMIPFRRGSKDFFSQSGVQLVRASIQQILGTRAAFGSYSGDLRWRPEFGSKLWTLRHQNKDPDIEGLIEIYVAEAFEQEPRARLVSVFVEGEEVQDLSTLLRVRVKYAIIDANVEGNRVLLPDVFEEIVTV